MLIHVDIASQRLALIQSNKTLFSALVSTSIRGTGNRLNSYQTPLGEHRVRAMIGFGLPSGSVLVGRRWTGEVYDSLLAAKYPQRDWILSRILWLCGNQPNYNRLGDVDTMRRYIYIHGAPDDVAYGTPTSQGCIRMSNANIISLFDMVQSGIRVNIEE